MKIIKKKFSFSKTIFRTSLLLKLTLTKILFKDLNTLATKKFSRHGT